MARQNSAIIRQMAIDSMAASMTKTRMIAIMGRLSPAQQTNFLKAVAQQNAEESSTPTGGMAKPTKTQQRASGAETSQQLPPISSDVKSGAANPPN